MSTDIDGEQGLLSRNVYLLAMLTQTLGLNTIFYGPYGAVSNGAIGHGIAYVFIYIMIGIPLTYMEYVVGQFTGRDCLEVWQARAFLSHFGYVHIFWQIVFVLYSQTMSSFAFHYFLVSFQPSITYHSCGWWSNADCDLLKYNQTVNEYCLKRKQPLQFCIRLDSTFPEYQYWRFYILGGGRHFHFPWHVCLACVTLSGIVFLSYFRRMQSWQWGLVLVTIYPIIGRLIFFAGSMVQKGIVKNFESAMDLDFSVFNEKFNLVNCLAEALYSLNVGTGFGFNLGSRAPFRSPCYANMVITVVITSIMLVIGISSVALMACSYAFKYEINPISIMQYQMPDIYVKTPRLLYEYESQRFWLLLSFSFIAVSGMSRTLLILPSLVEMGTKRSIKLANSPGLMSCLATLVLFLFTVPLLSNIGLFYIAQIKVVLNSLVIFLALMESLVFVMWYGMGRFFEDIHFMQGIPPKAYVKVCWVLATATAGYLFVMKMYEFFDTRCKSKTQLAGFYCLVTILVLCVLVTVIKLFIAFHKNKLKEAICLDPKWGPRTEVLRRSRTMFTAQAMTKEYMYRQYHLKAGILKRQKMSNVRAKVELDFEE